jgi:hypothetical protein
MSQFSAPAWLCVGPMQTSRCIDPPSKPFYHIPQHKDDKNVTLEDDGDLQRYYIETKFSDYRQTNLYDTQYPTQTGGEQTREHKNWEVESFAKLKKTAIILTHALYNTRTSL